MEPVLTDTLQVFDRVATDEGRSRDLLEHVSL